MRPTMGRSGRRQQAPENPPITGRGASRHRDDGSGENSGKVVRRPEGEDLDDAETGHHEPASGIGLPSASRSLTLPWGLALLYRPDPDGSHGTDSRAVLCPIIWIFNGGGSA